MEGALAIYSQTSWSQSLSKQCQCRWKLPELRIGINLIYGVRLRLVALSRNVRVYGQAKVFISDVASGSRGALVTRDGREEQQQLKNKRKLSHMF